MEGRYASKGPAASGGSRGVCRIGSAAVFGVDALGFFELVLEDDDAAGGVDGGALVDEFPGAGGNAQLVAGVAAVSACGTQWCDEAGFADRAEEVRCGAKHFDSQAHGVGGVVVVIETAV
jgi:hypothetical protein